MKEGNYMFAYEQCAYNTNRKTTELSIPVGRT